MPIAYISSVPPPDIVYTLCAVSFPTYETGSIVFTQDYTEKDLVHIVAQILTGLNNKNSESDIGVNAERAEKRISY